MSIAHNSNPIAGAASSAPNHTSRNPPLAKASYPSLHHLGLTATVVGEGVDGSAGETRENVRVGGLGDVRAELRGGRRPGAKEVGAEAGDVGAGHRSARDGALKRS